MKMKFSNVTWFYLISAVIAALIAISLGAEILSGSENKQTDRTELNPKAGFSASTLYLLSVISILPYILLITIIEKGKVELAKKKTLNVALIIGMSLIGLFPIFNSIALAIYLSISIKALFNKIRVIDLFFILSAVLTGISQIIMLYAVVGTRSYDAKGIFESGLFFYCFLYVASISTSIPLIIKAGARS